MKAGWGTAVPSTGGRAAASLLYQEPPQHAKTPSPDSTWLSPLSRAVSKLEFPHGNSRRSRDTGALGQKFLWDCMSHWQVKVWDCTPPLPINPLPSLPSLTMMYFWLSPAIALQLFISVKASGKITNNQPSSPKLHSTHLSPPYPTMVLPPSPGSSQESDLVPRPLHQTGHSFELTALWHSLSFSG